MTAKHAYKVGDSVVVYNQTLSGREVCEGRAKVRKLVDQDDTYMVQFDGSGELPVERVVPLDAADLPDDDPRVSPHPQPPVDMSRAISREIPNP